VRREVEAEHSDFAEKWVSHCRLLLLKRPHASTP
jgi:hypothetical protein